MLWPHYSGCSGLAVVVRIVSGLGCRGVTAVRGGQQFCVCVHAAARAWLGWEQIPAHRDPCWRWWGAVLLEKAHTWPTAPLPQNVGLHGAVVKCFQHQPVAWVDEDQGPQEETRLWLLLLGSAHTRASAAPASAARCVSAGFRALRALPLIGSFQTPQGVSASGAEPPLVHLSCAACLRPPAPGTDDTECPGQRVGLSLASCAPQAWPCQEGQQVFPVHCPG